MPFDSMQEFFKACGQAQYMCEASTSDFASYRKSKDSTVTGDCAVCLAPNGGYHFGCIACAACSAFFRRTIALRRVYLCRRDPTGKSRCPLDRRHRSNCKSCRFARCLQMGMNPSGVQNLRDSIRAPQTPEPSSPPLSVETHASWTNSSISSAGHVTFSKEDNTIEILVDAYKKSVERRRMFYCNGSLREMLKGEGLTMRPTKFDERYYKDKMRFELILYLEMMNSLAAFRNFDTDTKESLVRHCAVSLALLEKYFVSVKNEGVERNRLIAPDGSYMDLADHGAQFDDNMFEMTVMDRETCLALLYDPLKEVLQQLGGALQHSQMSNVEFCALFAILLFNTAANELTEPNRQLVQAARNRVLKDWFDYYDQLGIGPNESSVLVGNTLLLLTAVRNALHVHRENFHVIRVFNVMEYDKLIDDLAFT